MRHIKEVGIERRHNAERRKLLTKQILKRQLELKRDIMLAFPEAAESVCMGKGRLIGDDGIEREYRIIDGKVVYET